MKKFILIFGLFSLFNSNSWAVDIQTDEILQKVQQENKEYKKICFEQEAFPKGLSNYNIYSDDIKEGNYRYHQCLKGIIVKKIRETVAPKHAEKMIANLDKIQDGISDFYWILYTYEDTGTIGRDVNDSILGRRFEEILEDLIYYQYLYKH